MGNHKSRLTVETCTQESMDQACQPHPLSWWARAGSWTSAAAGRFRPGIQQGAPETAWDSEHREAGSWGEGSRPESGPRSSKDKNHCTDTVSPFSHLS